MPIPKWKQQRINAELYGKKDPDPVAPPPPDPVPDPVDPPPPAPPVFDFTGQQTTNPAPGGFADWNEYNIWRRQLAQGMLPAGVRAAPSGRRAVRRDGEPGGGVASRTGNPPNDPSELQDRLGIDRERTDATNPLLHPLFRGPAQVDPLSAARVFPRPPALFDEVIRQRPQISDPYPILPGNILPVQQQVDPRMLLLQRLLGGF